MQHSWFLLSWLVFLACSPCASARPAHKKTLADYFGNLLPRHLNDCRACHVPEKPGQKEDEHDKPHNPFGARLREVRAELKKASKESDIAGRLKAIAGEDSDGDGVSNLLELLSGRNPGEASDRAMETDLARGRRLLDAFQKRTPYSWQPFAAVKKPALPRGGDASRDNPIDAFLAEQRALFVLKPRPRAAPETLARRLFLDLIGLPPTPEDLAAFETASRGDPQRAIESLARQLLERPEHGERWARHWMDIWRYVDHSNSGLQDGWVGAQHMWRWRDWIVASLNEDKGYDRMVQEMLAGDELAPEDPRALAATAFIARNKSVIRDQWLHETVNHATRAFLGITMECARCHDHKYDPLTQVEYYQLRAIFEPVQMRTDPSPENPADKKAGLTRVHDGQLSPTYLYVRGVEQNPDKSKVIPPGVPELLNPAGFQIEPIKGTGKGGSSGRRLAFARWLTQKQNPLTARVAVNHIWLRHFGQALTPSVFDFGAGGLPPSHPALLDWLAAEFMEQGWSMKKLHFVIVTSQAYQMASTPDSDNLTFDPENQFYWRMPPRRMEAEVVRDAILAITGNLDSTRGGPELDPKKTSERGRRSIYYRYTDSDYLRFMEFFDPPTVGDCYYRPTSIVPQQALTLLNSELTLMQSRSLARTIDRDAKGEDQRFVRDTFLKVLARAASPGEEALCLENLTEQRTFFEKNRQKVKGTSDAADLRRGSSDPALRARENLVHLLLNHHDFVTIR